MKHHIVPSQDHHHQYKPNVTQIDEGSQFGVHSARNSPKRNEKCFLKSKPLFPVQIKSIIHRRAKFGFPGQVKCYIALLTCISLATGAPFDKSYDLHLLSPNLDPSSNFAHEEAHEKQLATNYFVDNIIEAFLNSWASKLDPLRVQKFRLAFSKDFLGLQFNGEYD